jgi:hypothetical protein
MFESDCQPCLGKITPALQAELMRRAHDTKPCYDRTLVKKRNATGHLTVQVRIGKSGGICSDKVVEDGIGDEKLAVCARSAFEGSAGTLPPPEGGCIVVNVPMSFVLGDAGVAPGEP